MQFLFEDEFSKLIGRPAQPLPTLNAPGNQPRFIITDGKRTLAVSNVSAQLTLDFGKSLPSGQSMAGVLKRPAAEMDAALDKIFAHQKRAYSAIIVVWVAPNPNLERLAQELAGVLIKPTFSETITTASIVLGLQAGEFNRTVEVSQYKTWLRMAALGAPFLAVDQDFDPPDDLGLQIKLDVNNKQLMDAPPKGALSAIIPIFVSSIENDLPSLVTPELVAKLPK